MQIQIEIISIGQAQTIPTKNGKSYKCIEIAYKRDGKIEGKKLMDFSNPAVFKTVQNLAQGEVVSVTSEKNDAGYWQWTNVEPYTAVTETPVTTNNSTSRSYETKEEKDFRQTMIVRQSSIASAVNLLKGIENISVQEVINTAKTFESYVMNNQKTSNSPFPEGYENLDNLV